MHGLYANVAGVMTAHNRNILGSHVYSTRSGLALEVYRVMTPPGGDAERQIAWSEFDRSLRSVLAGELAVEALQRRRGRPIGLATAPSRKPPTVSVSNEESDFYTVVDIAANDRLGLLHDLTRTIAEHGFEIYISKAATIMDQVTDTFYLKDHRGKKLGDRRAIERLRHALRAAARHDEDGGGS